MSRLSIFLCLAPLLYSTGCKPNSLVNYSGFIIGAQDDIEPLTADNIGSVGEAPAAVIFLLVTKRSNGDVKFCSGSLISVDDKAYFTSNHHCFSEGENNPKLLPEACTASTIFGNFTQQSGKPTFRARCKEGSLRTDPQLDLSTMEIEGSWPESATPLELWDDKSPYLGRSGLIVHYPNVEAFKSRIDELGALLPMEAITSKDCTTGTPFTRDEWFIDPALPFSFRHTCDLVHGSSGSPLLDSETRKVLGVNWGGVKIVYSDREEVYNAAVSAKNVRTFLLREERQQPHGADSLPAGAPGEADMPEDGHGKKDSFVTKVINKARCGVLANASPQHSLWLLHAFIFCIALFCGRATAQTAAPQDEHCALRKLYGTLFLEEFKIFSAVYLSDNSAVSDDFRRASFYRATIALIEAGPASAASSQVMAYWRRILESDLIPKSAKTKIQGWQSSSDASFLLQSAVRLETESLKNQTSWHADWELATPLFSEVTQCPSGQTSSADNTASQARSIEALTQEESYSAALAIAFDLQKRDPRARLAYQIVQRIFGARHQGQGQVALEPH